MIKFLSLIATGLMVLFLTDVYPQDFQWAVKAGNQKTNYDAQVEIDNDGNIILMGDFRDSITIDSVKLYSPGDDTPFIMKMDPDGNVIWVYQIYAKNHENSNLRIDQFNNFYISSEFGGTVDLDMKSGSSLHTSRGYRDIFVAKYDADANLIWDFTLPCDDEAYVADIHIDKEHNVYICGSFQDTIDLDPSSAEDKHHVRPPNHSWRYSAFYAKYDSIGNYVWGKSMKGTHTCYAEQIRTTDEGVYIAVTFRDTIWINKPTYTYYMKALNMDALYALCDSMGNIQWANRIYGSGHQIIRNMVVAGNGDLIIGGYIGGLPAISGYPTLYPTTYGSGDIFLARYRSDESRKWFAYIGSTNGDNLSEMILDKNENIYISGSSYGNLDFDTSIYYQTLSPVGSSFGFIAKYDSSMQLQFARSIQSNYNANVNDIGRSSYGELYVTGSFRDSVVLDSSHINGVLSGNSIADIFYAKYNTCVKPDTPSVSYIGSPVCQGNQITIFIDSGRIQDANDWMWTADSCNGSSLGYGDSINIVADTITDFYVKGIGGCADSNCVSIHINNYPNFLTFDSVSTCQGTIHYFPDGDSSSQNGIDTSLLSSVNGCDSIVVSYLTVDPISSLNTSHAMCPGTYYVFPDMDSSNVNTVDTSLLVNRFGCDSTIITQLTFWPEHLYQDTASICSDSIYTFPDGDTSSVAIIDTSHFQTTLGCDSSYITHLIVNPVYHVEFDDSICKGKLYYFPDSTASDSTLSHLSQLNTLLGCDSFVTVNLKVNQAIAGIQLSSDSLYSVNKGSYQWYNCDELKLVPFENNRWFVPGKNGNYSLIFTKNGCRDTSNCIEIIIIGTLENHLASKIEIYPNPTKGEFTVKLGDTYKNVLVKISNLTGQMISMIEYQDVSSIKQRIEGVSGVYLIQIITNEGKSALFKVQKE